MQEKKKNPLSLPYFLSLSLSLSLALPFPVYSPRRTSLGNLTIPNLFTRFCLFPPFSSSSSSCSLIQTSKFTGVRSLHFSTAAEPYIRFSTLTHFTKRIRV
ncbi:hypothetical protein L6452_14812 [Arctium lappa]|uniref:Uncharacterized protein n=1 Tax=Arctium lappa TaxID=4217 RepID=A0ACB9CM21_ARCLA|nr:hypothetical protein L6452_14812 [Arctium lappa]